MTLSKCSSSLGLSLLFTCQMKEGISLETPTQLPIRDKLLVHTPERNLHFKTKI